MIPALRHESYWTSDAAFQRTFLRRVGSASRDFALPLVERMGERAAFEAAPLGSIADREEPKLETHDRLGNRVDRVMFHPAYHKLEQLSYGEGIVQLKYDAGVRAQHGAVLHTLGFGLGYLFAQAEAGLYCPICMTDGAARLLELHAPQALREELLPRLTTRVMTRHFSGAMFLTETSGGSDVGAFTTVARPAGGATESGSEWSLTGSKWFCSNVNAQVILTLARPEGAGPGTRGLGLFVIVRDPDEGPLEGFRVERIKRKLGVRSMATGEVVLDKVRARLVAGEGAGFRAMSDMINLSRLYNAVTAVALLRRALSEAAHHGRERWAFGRPLVEHPLFAQQVAFVAARHRAALHLVFDAVAALDGADNGDERAARAARLLTAAAKYHTGSVAVWGSSQCLEALGGNGYIEDWPLARILRDAQVLPIWEGTSNIQLLDMHRALHRDRAHEPVLEGLDVLVERVTDAALREVTRNELALLREALVAAADRTEAPRGMRALADRLCWLHGVITLAGGPEAEPAMARLLAAAGPGLDEGPGPWNAVPAGWETEIVRTL